MASYCEVGLGNIGDDSELTWKGFTNMKPPGLSLEKVRPSYLNQERFHTFALTHFRTLVPIDTQFTVDCVLEQCLVAGPHEQS